MMPPKLVVLSSQQVGDGSVIQGRVDMQGKPVLAFLVQPNYESVVWLLPEGEMARTHEHTLGALNLILMAALSGPVDGATPAGPQSEEEFRLVQEAWRLGLSHGWTAAMNPDKQSASDRFGYLWHLVWPAQTHLEPPMGRA